MADGRAGGEEGTDTQCRAEVKTEDGTDGLVCTIGAGRCSLRQEDPALIVQVGDIVAQVPGHRLGSNQCSLASPLHSLQRAEK